MYHCVCSTCREDELVDDFERAQEYFNAHARSACEVEIINVDVVDAGRLPDVDRPTGDGPEVDARPADE